METPAFVVVCGPPCSGKSTIAGCLAGELAAVHLETDAIRVRLLPDSEHQKEHRDIAYRALHYFAELLIRLQPVVVLDATYVRAIQRRELKSLLDRTGARLYIVQCSANADVLLARLKAREPGRHAAVDLTPSGLRADALRFLYAEGAPQLRTDALSLDECLAAIRLYLDSAKPFVDWGWMDATGDMGHTTNPRRGSRTSST
jgi:predicted kinase